MSVSKQLLKVAMEKLGSVEPALIMHVKHVKVKRKMRRMMINRANKIEARWGRQH